MIQRSPLPDPDALRLTVERFATGHGFTITDRDDRDELIHHSTKTDYRTPQRAEAAAQRWIERYRNADARGRCRMCLYHWEAVRHHLPPAMRKAVA